MITSLSSLKNHSLFFYLAALALAVVGLVLGCSSKPEEARRSDYEYYQKYIEAAGVDAAFEAFCEELFLAAATSDSLTLNAYLQKPENRGITDFIPSLGNPDYEEEKQSAGSCLELLSLLSLFDYSSLNYEHKVTYEMLKADFELSHKLAGHFQYTEPLSMGRGAHLYLPLLLAEYRISDAADASEYLLLLKEIPGYFDKLLIYEEKRLRDGYYMPEHLAETVIGQCRDFISSRQYLSLLNHFSSALSGIALEKDKAALLTSECRRCIDEYVIPAYKKLAAGLEELFSSELPAKADSSDFPSYYEALVQLATGSSKTIPEMKLALTDFLFSCISSIGSYTAPSNEGINAAVTGAGPAEILDFLKASSTGLYPDCGRLTYNINILPEALSAYIGSALYIIPPLDDYSHNSIYIGAQYSVSDTHELLPTLAHEGFPGHMYMTVYNYSRGISPVRTIYCPLGYEEGWAVSAEMMSYRFLYESEACAEYYAAADAALLCLYALCDIGVNYDGWSISDNASFWAGYNVPSDIANEIYCTVLADPGIYLPYAIGCIEWNELRTIAEKNWGHAFNLLTYHTVILNLGPARFGTLKNALSSITICRIKK